MTGGHGHRKPGPVFLSPARSKLRLCSVNHMPGYWSSLPCDWPSTAWAYSEQETENGPVILVPSPSNLQAYQTSPNNGALCYLDLDLSLNCQAPCGYHGNAVCAHYGRVFGASWHLKEGTEAAEVMVSCKQFHWTTVLGANDSRYTVWRQRIVLSLLVVTLPHTGLVL